MARSTFSKLPRPSIRVAVLEKGQRKPRGYVPCLIGDALSFTTANLESYCLASWKPLVFDALVVAAAVEFCDRIQTRPALGWGRELNIRIPVHDVAHWNSRAVYDSLHGALEFLMGDQWKIEFVARQSPEIPPQQGQFDLPRGKMSIIPFSDGMDSRAVAELEARDLGDRLIRVRLGSKIIDRPSPTDPKQPFTTVPYRVNTGIRNQESSARSRGFKFAMVSGVAAYLIQADEIIVPESGQGALGPALVSVGHAYADYRNHPLFTDRMATFLSALFGHNIRYRFPRIWRTKGQTITDFAAVADIHTCLDARSCWQQSRQVSVDGELRQCGICAACMLRRLSVHAAGFAERPTTYIWENLSAPTFEQGAAKGFDKITPALREYAIAGVLHMDQLATIRTSALHQPAIARLAFQLSKSLNLSQTDAESRLDALLAEHCREWHRFLDSLDARSFVKKWTTRSYEHAA